MKNRYLTLYKTCIENGTMSHDGLCWTLTASMGKRESNRFESVMKPKNNEIQELKNDGLSYEYWASGLKVMDRNKFHKFTSLRETILLLWMAHEGYL